MNLQTFKAATMAEALHQVKQSMGHDAVILHTRTYQSRHWLGLRRKEIVEITAGRSMHLPGRNTRRQPANTIAPQQTQSQPIVYTRSAQPTVMAPPRDAVVASRQLLETPAASNALMLGLSKEMDSLKTMVKDLVSEVRHREVPQVHEDLFEYYMQLIQSEVAEELATEVVKTLQKTMRPEHFTQPEFMREKLAEQIEKMLPTCGPIRRTKTSGPHVVALIGPTGVGKTTTIAKLAANLKLREKHRVGLITIDTYRIAAIDQLKKYADIIGAPLKVVGNPEDLRDAIASMYDCEFILIDTAGRSPNDTLKLNELKNFLAAAAPDEIHLVLSCTASQNCVELAISRFSEIGAEKIIFTKIDEAAHVGVVFNVIRKVNKSLSYVTTGQDVPDDIEVGRGRRLAQMLLGEPCTNR